MRKSRFREEQMVKILREANAASVPCSTSPSKAIADAAICERMRAIAAQYSRYGHRFVRIFLEPEGHRMSFTRAYRLWNAAGL